MDTNKVIQSLWIGERLSTMERLCIESFLQNGHDFHLYAYAEIENVPPQTHLCDANEILSQSKIFHDSRKVVASFSDWFRYKLLYLKGGWWVDMDMICIRPFDISAETCFATAGAGGRKNLQISAIKARAGDKPFRDCLRLIETLRENIDAEVTWGSIGSSLLQKCLSAARYGEYIMPSSTFCPVHWSELSRLIARRTSEIDDSTLSIHLWNEIWRLGFMDKNAIYHPESLYEIYKQKYGLT